MYIVLILKSGDWCEGQVVKGMLAKSVVKFLLCLPRYKLSQMQIHDDVL